MAKNLPSRLINALKLLATEAPHHCSMPTAQPLNSSDVLVVTGSNLAQDLWWQYSFRRQCLQTWYQLIFDSKTISNKFGTFHGPNSIKIVLPPSWKRVYSKRKEFASLEGKFFPLRPDPLPFRKNSFLLESKTPFQKVLGAQEALLMCNQV